MNALDVTDLLMRTVAAVGRLALRLDAAAQSRQLGRELDDGTLELHGAKLGLDEDGCVCNADDCFARWHYRGGEAA